MKQKNFFVALCIFFTALSIAVPNAQAASFSKIKIDSQENKIYFSQEKFSQEKFLQKEFLKEPVNAANNSAKKLNEIFSEQPHRAAIAFEQEKNEKINLLGINAARKILGKISTKKSKDEKKLPKPAVSKASGSDPFVSKKDAKAIVAKAKKYIGVKYVYGGTTPKGFDCSGLVQYVFKQQGYKVPRLADEQYNQLGKLIKPKKLSVGDLVFFDTDHSKPKSVSHVGIFMGSNKFIHASSSKGVRIDKLTDSYWKKRFFAAKQIVKK